MGRFNWGMEGPPEDAYSRVTEPERFLPMHQWALELVARLEAEYELNREEGQGVDAELESRDLDRPTIKLTPTGDSYASITIAFTDFPGLRVRAGQWGTESFPVCGCDACDEMPDEEFERFERLMGDVVAGRFRESLSLGPRGEGWSRMETWSARGSSSSGGSRLSNEEAVRILKGEREVVVEWQPWPKRLGSGADL